MKIGFIGAGNMANAIIRGICSKELLKSCDIYASNPTKAKLDKLSEDLGICTATDNKEVARISDILFLCVKPQKMAEVIAEIAGSVKDDALVVSIAAGKTLDELSKMFGSECVKLVRVMPNAPCLTGDGICAVTPSKLAASDPKLDEVMRVLGSVGEVAVVDEPLIDIVGQIAGASPAWIAMVIEAMADGAVHEGMPRDMAYKFAATGIEGAAAMVRKLGGNPGKIKDMVASPKGTTIEGIKVLEDRGMRSAFMDAVIEACEKSKKL